MGRPTLSKDDRKSPYILYKYEKPDRLENIVLYAKREGKAISDVLNMAFDEFWIKHGLGNSQTLIVTYSEGKAGFGANLEKETLDFFLSGRKEIKKQEINDYLVAHRLNDGRSRYRMVDRIASELNRSEVVKVWS